MNYKERIFNSTEYDFLKTNEHLGDKIILLGLGGSHAYGTNIETSDLDVRGIALSSREEILTNKNFEQVCDNATDTTIYSFNKMISLLSNCNPNTIEMLGLKPEHYLKVTSEGELLLKNKEIFLSRKAAVTFGGYAYAQLRRLDNKSARTLNQPEHEQHILNSINNVYESFAGRYKDFPKDCLKLYIDTAINPEMEKEIFMDVNLTHYPLRDYKSMWSEMNNVVKDYAKLGKRNQNAIEHGKIAKHMMHLLRLYMMCIDILDKHEIITYREDEHNLLMSIRNGNYLDKNNQPTKEFFDMVEEYQRKMEEALKRTTLPSNPDYDAINKLMVKINYSVVCDS